MRPRHATVLGDYLVEEQLGAGAVGTVSRAIHRPTGTMVALSRFPRRPPPEQWQRGGTVTARSDLYALGCVLWTWTTGQPPFDGDVEGLRTAHTHTPLPAFVRRFPVPDELAPLLEDLLAKDPVDRPATAEAVRRRLRAGTRTSATRALTTSSAPLPVPAGMGLSLLPLRDHRVVGRESTRATLTGLHRGGVPVGAPGVPPGRPSRRARCHGAPRPREVPHQPAGADLAGSAAPGSPLRRGAGHRHHLGRRPPRSRPDRVLPRGLRARRRCAPASGPPRWPACPRRAPPPPLPSWGPASAPSGDPPGRQRLGRGSPGVIALAEETAAVVLAHNRRFEEAVAIVSALGDRPLALRVRAIACRGTGDLDGALELFRRALDRCTERDDNLRAALANDIGAVNGTLGNHAVAEPWFRRSVSYADRNTSFTQALNIPIALVAQGRPEDAVRPARHALVLAERVGKLVPYAYTTHAIVAALAGRSEEARRYGDAALAMARLDRCTVLRPLQASIREARSEEPVIQAFLDALRAAMEEAYTSKHATCRGGP